MIDPTPRPVIGGHYHAVTGDESRILAWIPEHVMEDRQAMLNLRDVLALHLQRTQPSFTESLGTQ